MDTVEEQHPLENLRRQREKTHFNPKLNPQNREILPSSLDSLITASTIQTEYYSPERDPQDPDKGQNQIKIITGVDQHTDPEQIIRELNVPPYDRAIFVMGGADDFDKVLLTKIQDVLSQSFVRIAEHHQGKILVGDGGTESGIMNAIGEARKKAKQNGNRFSLIGVPPAEEINVNIPFLRQLTEKQKRQSKAHIEDNHSHIIPVVSKPEDIGQPSAWGNETKKMYQIFNKLAEGKPSIGIVANGGRITLDEVIQNVIQERNLIVLQGTGRAADLLAAIFHDAVATLDPQGKPYQLIEILKEKVTDQFGENQYEEFITKLKARITVVDIKQDNAVDQIVNLIENPKEQ